MTTDTHDNYTLRATHASAMRRESDRRAIETQHGGCLVTISALLAERAELIQCLKECAHRILLDGDASESDHAAFNAAIELLARLGGDK